MQKIRQQILIKVQTEVLSLLSQSLHQGVMINLPPERQSEQPERLWDIQLKIGNRQTVNLDRETNINTVFTQTNGRLLILGTVGSGKTTTMLELTLELVDNELVAFKYFDEHLLFSDFLREDSNLISGLSFMIKSVKPRPT